MLRCVLCGEDLGDKDGYIRGSISGEVIELADGPPKSTGQINSWQGVAFCLDHFESIPKNIADNLGLIATARKKREK